MALTKGQRARIERYDRENRECSRIILADIEKYGGEGSCAVQWARAIQRKQPDYWPEGDLFDERETGESVCLTRF